LAPDLRTADRKYWKVSKPIGSQNLPGCISSRDVTLLTLSRMPGYFVSYIIFIIFLFPSAWAQGFATMVVTRFFGGGASSVSINIVGGTITDIWRGDKARSLPMSIFGMTSVIGIALGPFIGGAIQRNLNWRWIYWIQIIFDAGCLPIFWFILKETRGDVILAKRAKKLRKQGRNAYAKSELNKDSVVEMLKISFKRPTKMLVTEFVVIAFTLWVSRCSSHATAVSLTVRRYLSHGASSFFSKPVSPSHSRTTMDSPFSRLVSSNSPFRPVPWSPRL